MADEAMPPPTPKGAVVSLADALKVKREAEAEAAFGPRRPLDWSSLATRSPPVRPWRIAHWLSDGPMLLAGAGGIGKTLLAQTLATALALGRYFLDDVLAPSRVLFWACEDDHDELWRRQLAICAFFGVTLADLDGHLTIEPRLGRDNALFGLAFGQPTWTPLRAELTAQVNDYKADVLILDNVGQTFGGQENDRHHVTTFVNGLASLGGDRSLSTLLLGHPAKATDSEYSGSTAWENAVRMRWFFGATLPDQPEEGPASPDVRYLAKRKANYTAHDWRRLQYVNGVFVPDAVSGGSIADRHSAEARAESAQRCVLHALARLAEASIRTTDGATSPDFLPRKMRETKLAADFTVRELTDAMRALQLAGQIEEGPVGHYRNRTQKFGLKVVF